MTKASKLKVSEIDNLYIHCLKATTPLSHHESGDIGAVEQQGCDTVQAGRATDPSRVHIGGSRAEVYSCGGEKRFINPGGGVQLV